MTTIKNRLFFFLTGNFKHLKADGWDLRAYRPRISKNTRLQIYKRDNNVCRYCNQQFPKIELSLDHYIPYKDCKNNDSNNLVTSCIKCNRLKSSINPNTDKLGWHRFLIKVSGIKAVQTTIRQLETQLYSQNININEFISTLTHELKKQPSKKYSFTRKTNLLLQRKYPSVWSNIYSNSHINSDYLIKG